MWRWLCQPCALPSRGGGQQGTKSLELPWQGQHPLPSFRAPQGSSSFLLQNRDCPALGTAEGCKSLLSGGSHPELGLPLCPGTPGCPRSRPAVHSIHHTGKCGHCSCSLPLLPLSSAGASVLVCLQGLGGPLTPCLPPALEDVLLIFRAPNRFSTVGCRSTKPQTHSVTDPLPLQFQTDRTENLFQENMINCKQDKYLQSWTNTSTLHDFRKESQNTLHK